ncbi:MAG: hypothetical protein A4E59_01805 [Syntrophorhabdus sp. PtaB.Bin027]|jgi:hypothetical protein|nr:MAG: hypothetical protein A4E59_01805 [Syntrophorhabdus sp. PtaB.Bin027]OQB74321.1 MAG: hypothetical protein BWX92_03057 [Deltaproteobacteria bacterium ADurb.Bin135]
MGIQSINIIMEVLLSLFRDLNKVISKDWSAKFLTHRYLIYQSVKSNFRGNYREEVLFSQYHVMVFLIFCLQWNLLQIEG